MGFRTILSVPLMREGVAIGSIQIRRTEAQLFTERQVALLETFAEQAVIAIENVRLFKELEARNGALGESLEQQTATSEILRVISSSPTDVQPVLDAVTECAARLCESLDSAIWRRDGDRCLLIAHNGGIPIGPIGEFSLPLVRGTVSGRSVLDGQTIHVADAPTEVDEFPESSENARRMGFRTILNVPLMREGVAIGVISLRRTEVQLFTERQVALLETFADQAVIAIENVRLFQELEARTRDLTQSVGELRALGEVSQAVGSTLDLETVLATIVSRAVQLSGSDQGLVYEFDEATQTFEQRATHQITPEYVEALRAAPIRLGEGAMGRAGVIREPVQVADIRAEWQLVAPQVRAFLDREGVRSLLAIPLIREERLLGGLVILRTEPGAFSPAVVATLQTFAAQSVLAIHNAGLFREIQRQKQYSDALVETSPVAIATMDLRGAVVGWNPGAERLFGYSPAEALGRAVDELVATPEIREEVRENLRQMHSGQRVRAITRRARKDGTLVDVEVSSMPVVVDGAEVGSIAIYHDITELLQTRREAEAANEAKSAFLATMSHEIRTPMNAVIGMSGLLLNTALSDEQREYAEIVRQSGDTLLTVINDILDFSKIEAGRLDLESQPFDLRECVEGALDLVAARAAEKGLDLAYVLGDGAPAAIVGDVTRLRQILLNLLSNAVKFTERGEVVLSVSAQPHRAARLRLHELTFSVRDTGIGIPADRLDRLFQSFSQVDASTTRRYGGTGLGLAISQRLTELMGGRIGVESEVGIGQRLPLHDPRGGGRSARPEPPRSERRAAVASRQAGARRGRQCHQPPHPRPCTSRPGACCRGRPDRPPRRSPGFGPRSASTSPSWTCTCRRWMAWPSRVRSASARRARRCPWSSSRRSAAARRAPRRRASPRTCTSRSSRRSSSTRWPPSWPTGRSTCRSQARLAPSSTRTWRAVTRCGSSWPRTTWSTRSWPPAARADGLPRRPGGQRARGDRRGRAADVRRGSDGRADAGDGRPRGLARDQPALAGRASPAASSP